MLRTLTILTALVIAAGLISVAEVLAKPITVTEPDCLLFPDPKSPGVKSGDTIILWRDFTVDTNGVNCIEILNKKRVKIYLNGRTINVGGGVNGIHIGGSSSNIQILGPGKIGGFINGIDINGSTKITVRELVLVGNTVEAIWVRGNSTHVVIEENIVFDNGGNAIILQQTNDNTVGKNEVFANGHGIIVLDGASDNTIESNNISSHAGDGIDIYATAGTNNVVENNIILDNGGFDIDLHDGAGDVTITNNICETSFPGGLCPDIVPDFSIDHF